MTNRRSLFILLLVGLPVVIYGWSVLHNPFVSLDDAVLITKNAAVQSITPRTLFHIFTTYDPELYIPLTFFTYQIEFAIVGAQPLLYHLTNLALHIGSSIFLFFFLLHFFNRGQNARAGFFETDCIAFIGALLFAVHPLNVETVAWAAARKDVLSALFFFASLYFYERCREDDPEAMPWSSVILFLLALLSKVSVAPLPALLVLLEWRRGTISMKNLKQIVPHAVLSALFILIAIIPKAGSIGELGLWKTILLGCKATVFSIMHFVLPLNLSVVYPQQTSVTLASPEFWIPVVFVIILVMSVVLLRRRWKEYSVGLLFFLLTLAPSFANFSKNHMLFFASDRYAYLSSAGLILIMCSLLLFAQHKRWHVPVFGILFIVCALFALKTLFQTQVWAGDIALYSNTLALYPDSALAANNLGDAYVRANKLNDALPYFTKAIEAKPDYVQAMTNAGNVERALGNYEAARTWYEKGIAAIGSMPTVEGVAAHYLLGELLMQQGKTDEGLAHFKTATELLPDNAEAWFNYGLTLQSIGRSDQAMPFLRKAIDLDTEHIAARYHLAGIYAEKGMLAQARDQLAAVVAIDPGYQEASKHLQAIEQMIGR